MDLRGIKSDLTGQIVHLLYFKDDPSPLWSLPDFGDPLTTRNREKFHEPAQNYHYSDTEDQGM